MPEPMTYPAGMGELLNVAHPRTFSLLFVNYSLMLAIAGGIAMLWAIYFWRGRREGPEFRFAMPMVVALVVAGFLNVLSEVNQPSRLLYGYIYGWSYGDTAIIKYGIILLPLLLVLSWWMTWQTADRDALHAGIEGAPAPLRPVLRLLTLWSDSYDVFEAPATRRVVLALMFALGLFAASYSGIFLMTEHGVAAWNTPMTVFVFLATGVAAGAGFLAAVAPLLAWLSTGEWRHAAERFRWTTLGGAVVVLLLWYGWLWWLGHFSGIEHQRYFALIEGPLAGTVFWHTLVIGVLVPVVLLITPAGRTWPGLLVATIGLVWGGYAIRYVVVVGAQMVSRSAAGELAFTPNAHVLWTTGFAVLTGVSLMVLLAALLPVPARPAAAAARA